MMWEEFEKLAGYQVTFKDYNEIIEPMYTATNLSKEEFVKCLNKKRFALRTEKEIVADMRKEAKHILETCESYTDFQSRKRLEELAQEYANRFWGGFEWYIRDETYGGRFWGLPGHGCSFPAKLVLCGKYGTTHELKLA